MKERRILIEKVGLNTIVTMYPEGNPELSETLTYIGNHKISIINDVMHVEAVTAVRPVLLFKLEELVDKFGATTLEELVVRFSELFIFTENASEPVDQDNILIRQYVYYYTTSAPNIIQTAALINALPSHTVGEKEEILYIVYPAAIPAVVGFVPEVKKYRIADKGKGTYGVGGTPITPFDLELIYHQKMTSADIEDLQTTQKINLGDITGQLVHNVVNNRIPGIEIQDSNDGYRLIITIQNGKRVDYLFTGDGGEYGFDLLQSDPEDYQPFDSENTIVTRTSQLLNDGDGSSGGIFIDENALEVALGDYVDLTTFQIINGVKQFNSSPIVPDATGPARAVNLGQIEFLLSSKANTAEVILLSEKGIAGGVATLDRNGKVPLSQINDAILGNVSYQGLYNGTAITNATNPVLEGQPLPSAASGNKGWYFISNAEFTYNTIDYKIGDWIISNGITWAKVDNTDAVSSVAGLTGTISAANLALALGNVTDVSIQNEFGTEQFRMTDLLRIKGVNFNSASKQIEVNPLVGAVIFVSNTGNDSTAQKENRAKPYLTLDAAMAAYWLDTIIDYIEIISDSTFTLSGVMNNGTSNRKLDIRSQRACTINITRTGVYSVILGGTTIQSFIFNMPFGTLNFNPATSASWGQHSTVRPIINIIAQTVTFNSVHGGTGKFTSFDLTCDVLNINATSAGIVNDTGTGNTANIKVKTINFRGANSRLSGSFVTLTLDFNLITHDNTFFLNNATTTSLNLDHGSVSSVAPYVNTTNVLYLNSNNTNINYKTGAMISSNLSIQCQNNSGVMVLRGTCNYPNSDRLLNQVNIANTIFIRNANITCKMLFGNRCLETIDIDTSTITVTTAFGSAAQTNAGNTYATPTVRFKGINFIIGPTTDFNMYLPDTSFVQNNKPSVSTQQGILYTNGKFDRSKIDIYENPLNQYYDTTQRKIVIVNEKEEIFNKTLDSNKIYVIDAILEFTSTDRIIVPAGGLSISGYGFAISGFKGTEAKSILFESPAGGCGNLFMEKLSIEVSGTNAKIFNLTNAGAPTGGADAVEFNVVNFNNCTSFGELINFRQGLWDNIGIFGCKDGITLSGTWSGGFRISQLISRNFGTASVTSVLFKKGTSLLFKSRFLCDMNADFKVGGQISDFTTDNFDTIKLFQLKSTQITRNGVVDNNENYTGAMSAYNIQSDWSGNNGLKNSDLNNVTVTAATYSIPQYQRIVYITYKGSTDTVFTLPTIATSKNSRIMIINGSSGSNITINTNSGSNEIWEGGSLENTTNVLPGAVLSFYNNEENFIMFND